MHIKSVKVGNVKIGNDHISIQSMCSTNTEDIRATISQIKKLEKAGCELIRVAVPTEKAAKALSSIKKKISIPLIADIHFNPRLAILALENGADKIRINPGNIANKKALREIIKSAKKHHAAIRIGVNEGSLEKDLAQKHAPHSPKALALSAKRWIRFFEKENFKNLIISAKSSDVTTMIKANRLLKNCGYPLHIGVTESGTLETGTIRSAIGIGTLLAEGIGNTIRVSLAADPIEEVRIAQKILDALDIIRLPLRIIACPTCGRTKADVWGVAERLERDLAPSLQAASRAAEGQLKYYQSVLQSKTPHCKLQSTSIAVLGCGVNIIGESKSATYAIVGIDRTHFTLYKKMKPILKKATYPQILKYLKSEI